MKCKDCKYRCNVNNTEETGSALCKYDSCWTMVSLEDDCHYIPKAKKLTCGDCYNLSHDTACFGCKPEDSAYLGGEELCPDYRDKRKVEFWSMLMFWKVQQLYSAEEIHQMIDDFEDFYNDLTRQNG